MKEDVHFVAMNIPPFIHKLKFGYFMLYEFNDKLFSNHWNDKIHIFHYFKSDYINYIS